MSIRARNAHFTNWAKVVEALQNAGFLIPNNDKDIARTFLRSAKTDDITNPFYYMVCFIKDTQEIYTHGEFYTCVDNSDAFEVISTSLTGLAEGKQDKIDDLEDIRYMANGAIQRGYQIPIEIYSDQQYFSRTIDPWKLYSFNNVTTIQCFCGGNTDGAVGEYMLEVIIPEGSASTLYIDNAVWENGAPDLTVPGTYHINVMRGCATYAYFNKY